MDKPIHIITIDTEFSSHKDDIGIVGRIGKREYGVARILNLLDKYGVKATFFIDVYGWERVGKVRFKEICQSIKNRGHDLQLHTHPDHLFDKERGYMAEYSFDEQLEIIKKGKELFKEFVGEEPIAHRAGDWGADYGTMRILSNNGIYIDSSFFKDWSTCEISKSRLTTNRPMAWYSLLEIPVTTFKSKTLGMFRKYRYISTDGNSIEEIRYIIRTLEKKRVKIITSTFHSFSFLRWNSNRTRHWVDFRKVRKFDLFLKEITKDGLECVKTMKDIHELYKQKPKDILDSVDFVPKSKLIFSISRIKERLLFTRGSEKNGKSHTTF